jgi:hypothetical protein
MSSEESPTDVPQTLPQAPELSSSGGRGRAWLTLLIWLTAVFLIAWLLGFFNV